MTGLKRLARLVPDRSAATYWRWLEWVGLLVPVAIFLAYYFLMVGPAHELLHSVYGILILVALIVLFSRLMFDAIGRSPDVLIADEPTTSLDATVQLQYLKLLKEIQETTGAAIIFITHDLGIVARMCDRVAVMYAGRFVEQADCLTLFEHPAHPYTQALMRAVPDLDVDVTHLPSIEGQPPALDDMPPGCAFAPRCEFATEKCQVYPDGFAIAKGHTSRCWRHSGEYPVVD